MKETLTAPKPTATSRPTATALPTTGALFPLGFVVATPGAIEALAEAHGNSWRLAAQRLLARHTRGDWGDIAKGDEGANERSLEDGTRLLSVYRLRALTPATRPMKVWIITEWDRSATTLLLPEEY